MIFLVDIHAGDGSHGPVVRQRLRPAGNEFVDLRWGRKVWRRCRRLRGVERPAKCQCRGHRNGPPISAHHGFLRFEPPVRSRARLLVAVSTVSLQRSNRNLVRSHKFLLYSPSVNQADMKPTQDLPSLRQLHVFEAVARHKSIGRAAALVNLSQPAVTQAIAVARKPVSSHAVRARPQRFPSHRFRQDPPRSHRAFVRLHKARLAAIAG